MVESILDILVDVAIDIGLFGDGLELHSFLMGSLLPYVCLAISAFDRHIAALVFGLCVLSGYGLIPLPSTGVVEAKPWYFIIGSCLSSAVIYVLIRKQIPTRITRTN